MLLKNRYSFAQRFLFNLAVVVIIANTVVNDAAIAGNTPSPKNVYLYIGWPHNGKVIRGHRPFRVWFGLRNMGVAPKRVNIKNTGHHHLLIDTDLPPFDQVIPSDRNHIHFGAGQTQTRLELQPGKHTLQLLLGDHKHIPHNPPVFSKKITITIE